MTQAQWQLVQDLKSFQDNVREQQRQLQAQIENLDSQIVGAENQIKKICDCKDPQGKSTWISRFLFSECVICHKNDL
jgi:hypothetical protein